MAASATASLPFIKSFAIAILLFDRPGFAGSDAVNRNGSFWTYDRADAATGAAFRDQRGRMVSLTSKMVMVQSQHALRTGIHTQFTALAVQLADNNPTLWGHSDLLVFPVYGVWSPAIMRRCITSIILKTSVFEKCNSS
jgi:hypothetical protein